MDLRWLGEGGAGMHEPVFGHDRDRVIAAAQQILNQRGWCVFEVCTDVPAQNWESRLAIFNRFALAVAEAVENEIALEPTLDGRLTGCDRRTLQPLSGMGAYLCYLAERPQSPSRRPALPAARTYKRRQTMLVRDAMNPIVVSVGPGHTLREAAKRMTAHGVGAAVVLDNEAQGPGIITERDILHANGVGQSVDTELVEAHLTSEVVYASAEWSLEQAAAAMVRGGFRHIIVVDNAEAAGILSMRDIVRCWTADGASCEVGPLEDRA